MTVLLSLALLTALQGADVPESTGARSEAPDFATEVRPILARRCFACHGNDEETQEAGLRLDRFEDATRDRDGFPAVVPGDALASELFMRVTDEFDPMPPEHAGERLSSDEVELLRRWIDGGAEYAPHWAFVPPRSPSLGPPAPGVGAAHPIDALTEAALAERGLQRSEPADDYTLYRRLSLDLTGLPPSPKDARAYAESEDPAKLEAAVDRLLASPAYAERWAAVWLDLARYADSSGHGSDPLREIWRYRDWVIDAYDRNMPFDEFTVAQLAGDLLPDADMDSRLATAFHRNTMTNTEGGTDDEEFRVLAVKDRVNTTMQVWMGLTAGCAECHSHKYDPISHVEYYRLFDLFNQTEDADRNDDRPRLATPTPEQRDEYDSLSARLAAMDRTLADPMVDAALDERARREARLLARAEAAVWEPVMSGVDVSLDQSVRWPVGTRTPRALRVELGSPAGTQLRPGSLEVIALAAQARPVLVSSVRVELDGPDRILSLAEVELLDANGEPIAGAFLGAEQSSTAYGGDAARAVDGRTSGLYDEDSVTHTATEANPWWLGGLAEPVAAAGVRVWSRTDGNLESRLRGLRVVFLDGAGAEVWRSAPAPAPTGDAFSAASGYLELGPVVGEPLALELVGEVTDGVAVFRLAGSAAELSSDVQQQEWVARVLKNGPSSEAVDTWSLAFSTAEEIPLVLSGETLEGLRRPFGQRTDADSLAVREALIAHDPDVAALRRRRAEVALKRQELGVPTTPVMVELPPERRRQTHVLVRGNFLQPGEEVTAGVPAVFPPLPDGVEPDRLALAKWLVAEENPLVARVAVNRLWARLFGRGLVLSEGDFGSQAELPTHPELLDWLAVEFRRSGWDQKHMLRTIVTSRTYQQASDVRGTSATLDPEAVWLSRYPRQRLEAEMVRDYALGVSGLLSQKRFGPSVYPPQPEGLWKAAFNGQRNWKESVGEDRYRRGLYVFLRRTIPYPMLATFDAPSRENCTVQRIPTNTPLQAFITLNDPVFVEASQALARRSLVAAADARLAADVIGSMLWFTLARPPSPESVEVLEGLFVDAAAAFASDPEGAEAFGFSLEGESSASPAELAAWTLVASAALNLDRALTKE